MSQYDYAVGRWGKPVVVHEAGEYEGMILYRPLVADVPGWTGGARLGTKTGRADPDQLVSESVVT